MAEVKEEHKPTEEQQAVVEAARRKSGESVMANAYAGCAKSYTLKLAAREIKVPGLGLAFNKKIAGELQGQLPSNFSVKTMNGLGLAAWCRANPGMSLKAPDTRKLGRLVGQEAKARKLDLSTEQWEGARMLVNQAMLAGVTPGDQGMPMLADTRESWQGLADDLLIGKEDFDLLYELCHDVLEESIALGKVGVLSFDDQIYLSAFLGGKFPKFPVIIADEIQDLSPSNHRMIELALRPDGRIIGAGDEKQAIYAFRGASADSMGRIRALRAQWIDTPLRTTFRCPKVVVTRQQGHAPGFRAFEANRPGEYIRLPRFSEEDMLPGWGPTRVKNLLNEKNSLAIICRNNGPVLSLAFKLLREGIGVSMVGRDLGKGLITLSRKLIPEDFSSVETCAGLIQDWQDKECSQALANGNEEKVGGIIDRAECLKAVLSSAGVSNAGQLRDALTHLFSAQNAKVQMGSIHSVKGLEFDAVLHLDPWRLPSKWARAAAKAGDSRALVQEWNLGYVAETRTRDLLLTGNLEDFNAEN